MINPKEKQALITKLASCYSGERHHIIDDLYITVGMSEFGDETLNPCSDDEGCPIVTMALIHGNYTLGHSSGVESFTSLLRDEANELFNMLNPCLQGEYTTEDVDIPSVKFTYRDDDDVVANPYYFEDCDALSTGLTIIDLLRSKAPKTHKHTFIYAPVTMYDHSGISISKGHTGGWDRSYIGVAYVDHQQVEKELGTQPDPKSGWESYIDNAIERYSSYLEGQIYDIKLERDADDVVNWYTCLEGDKEYNITEILNNALAINAAKKAQMTNKIKRMIRNNVPLAMRTEIMNNFSKQLSSAY